MLLRRPFPRPRERRELELCLIFHPGSWNFAREYSSCTPPGVLKFQAFCLALAVSILFTDRSSTQIFLALVPAFASPLVKKTLIRSFGVGQVFFSFSYPQLGESIRTQRSIPARSRLIAPGKKPSCSKICCTSLNWPIPTSKNAAPFFDKIFFNSPAILR